MKKLGQVMLTPEQENNTYLLFYVMVHNELERNKFSPVLNFAYDTAKTFSLVPSITIYPVWKQTGEPILLGFTFEINMGPSIHPEKIWEYLDYIRLPDEISSYTVNGPDFHREN